MALASADVFAAFDVTDGAQERDISPILSKAIYYDLNLLGSMNVDFGSPVEDVVYRWNDDQLNADTATVNGSAASDATSITLDSGHGVHIGDLLYDTAINSTELIETTATGATAVTVVRSYGSAAGASIADNAVLGIIRREQEGSDIGSDRTLNPLVRTNYTHILSTFDVKISGSQLARKMATSAMQDFLAHQLANRAIEMKINLSRAFLYSESIADDGSDTAYRAMDGLRSFAVTSGITNASSEAISLAVLNTHNKSAVDLGVFPDTLVVGTDLVTNIAGIDASVRRLRESDKQVGYTVQEIMLAQGNMVRVVVDARVKTGDAFLFSSERVRALPLNGRAMFVLAGSDWVDAKKRRILGEWTLEVRNPNAVVYLRNKT
jgi:hypothetical protein